MYDNERTGQNQSELVLVPATVNAIHFGKKFSHAIDGFAYAEPLYVTAVAVLNKGKHNIVYVVTEHDSVGAFDADTNQPPVWRVSFLSPGVSWREVPSATHAVLA